MKIIVTGGAGFIGANFLNGLVPGLQEHQFINLDKLTYAANLGSLAAIDSLPNYALRRVDITDMDAVDSVFEEFDPDLLVHFAAESHVDRSILGPREFVRTNIEGTFNLLEACRKHWSRDDNRLFHHVSTDEVYGSLFASREPVHAPELGNPHDPRCNGLVHHDAYGSLGEGHHRDRGREDRRDGVHGGHERTDVGRRQYADRHGLLRVRAGRRSGWRSRRGRRHGAPGHHARGRAHVVVADSDPYGLAEGRFQGVLR